VSPVVQYWVAVGALAVVGAVGCVAARRSPGRVATLVGRVVCVVLLADAVCFVIVKSSRGWTVGGSLPLDLCDATLLIAALACWYPQWQLGFELTYFWGLAGTLQAVVTPDLSASFPQLEFIAFVVGHTGIVIAACFLVFGRQREPRRGAVARVFAITVAYTAVVAVADVITGANAMYLRRLPAHASLLSALGPWPWYMVGAAAIGLGLFVLLDLPFRQRTVSARRSRRGRAPARVAARCR
jgi:hypothetical integral membrane protein (TIGR02206 family)